MADQTNYFSLFLPPKGNNAGDLGKPLNTNFIIIDSALFDGRTNYANNPQTDSTIPLGAFYYDKITDNLYIKGSDGIKFIGSFGASAYIGGGGTGSGNSVDQGQLDDAVSQEVAKQLNTRIDEIDNDIIYMGNATASAIQAAEDANNAAADAILAANEASGFKVDAYDWSDEAKTQAGYASGYANTAYSYAEQAASSAGAAGESADLSRSYMLDAAIASGNSQKAADAAIKSEEETLAYEQGAEKAAQAAYEYSLGAIVGVKGAADYANAAFKSSTIAISKSGEAGEYALAAQIASGFAANYAGQAQTYMIQSAQASANAITAEQNAGISAGTASGYADSARLYSVSASGSAVEAKQQAELVAESLGNVPSSAFFQEQIDALSDDTQALARAITQVGSDYNGQKTLVQTQQESIDGILGSYTVKIDNNGYVAGYGLMSEMPSGGGIPTSSFVVMADKFAVVKPNAPYGEIPTAVFIVDTDTGNVTFNSDLTARKLYSTNWISSNGASGSYFNLNNGTITLGGDSDPSFTVDANGVLRAKGAEISGNVTVLPGSTGFNNFTDKVLLTASAPGFVFIDSVLASGQSDITLTASIASGDAIWSTDPGGVEIDGAGNIRSLSASGFAAANSDYIKITVTDPSSNSTESVLIIKINRTTAQAGATRNNSWNQDSMPASGMQPGDTWFCTDTNPENPNSGGLFIYQGDPINMWIPAADRTTVTMNNGIVTSGVIQVGNAVINAGMSGNKAVSGQDSDEAIRFWAGSDFAAREQAPFRVNQGGEVWMTSANVSGSITIGDGSSGYGNFQDKPTSLGDINPGEGFKLGTIAPSATSNTGGSGVCSDRPISGSYGDTYYCTDTGVLYLYTGGPSGWAQTADRTKVTIDNGIVTAGRLEVGTGDFGYCNAGINGSVTADPNNDIRFWAGSSFADAATSAKFVVTNSGVMSCTGALIRGTLYGEDLIAGGTIKGNTVQSNIYVAGASGWSINAGGDAEFNNVKVRGDIEATSIKANQTVVNTSNVYTSAITTTASMNASSASLDCTNVSDVIVSVSGDVYCIGSDQTSVTAGCEYWIKIYRDGVQLQSHNYQTWGYKYWYKGFAYTLKDSPGTGAHTYSISVTNGAAGSASLATSNVTLLGLKR